ncbi:MAG: YggT family protein [Candidatus Poribacteria bacterium]|nr:YggT family protein [Candidatus Poribacteria bacterium]
MQILAYLLREALNLYSLIVLVNVLLSWVVFGTQNLTVRRIYLMTGKIVEPLLQPIRNLLYPMTRNLGIDFSPIILLVLLQVLRSLLYP